jgi:uncharacterized membrane protein YphA (DoxX/SURF4 family)
MCKIYHCPYHFGAFVLRVAFGLLFILVAVKKFRMGYFGFAENLVAGDGLMAQEIPSFLLYAYGALTPAVELAAGILLLINKHVKVGYTIAALFYLSFIFGQMYDGNTSKVGTEYIPSLLAVVAGYWMSDRIATDRKEAKV